MSDLHHLETTSKAGTRVDAGLRSYMLKIYNYMTTGMLVTALSAFAILNTGLKDMLIVTDPATGAMAGFTGLGMLMTFAPLVIVFGMMFTAHRMQASTARLLFYGYAALVGLSLAVAVSIYTQESIVRTFLITAATFGGMSLFGYTTKKDLTSLGSFLIMGVWGLLVASIVNLFLQSGPFSYILSILGVGIFTGLIAYDTQKLKQIYFMTHGDEESRQKAAAFGALNLYIDFIALFLNLLRLIGDRR